MQGVFLAEVGCLGSLPLSKLEAGGGVGWREGRSRGLGFFFGADFSFSYTYYLLPAIRRKGLMMVWGWDIKELEARRKVLLAMT